MGANIIRRKLSLLLIVVMACIGSTAQAASWPPKGFHVNGDVYAKIPNAKELLAILSANKTLAAQSVTCLKYACGVVQVASRIGCTWWEINATVSGPASSTNSTKTPLGKIRVTFHATVPKKITTIYLRSREPLKQKISFVGITISCYHSPATEKIPSTIYKRVPKSTPTPTPTPTPTFTESMTPTPTPSAS